jgi:hypothetical protein
MQDLFHFVSGACSVAVACSAAFAGIPVVADRLRKCEQEGRAMQVTCATHVSCRQLAIYTYLLLRFGPGPTICVFQVVCVVSGGNVDLKLLGSYFGTACIHRKLFPQPSLLLTDPISA